MSVAIAIRKIPIETHYALKARAQCNGRSAESEARAILEMVLNPPQRVKIGSALAALGRKYGGIELETTRDPAPMKAAQFE
jgi:plasmid stability protein